MLADAPPIFASWEDYLERASARERLARCAATAKRANRTRLLSPTPEVRLCYLDVWEIMAAHRGHCFHCHSLAVENRPSKPNGAPLPWEHMGRRIGSLEHLKSRFAGGDNHRSNLAWACLWCNTWPKERRPFARDHGGLYPG